MTGVVSAYRLGGLDPGAEFPDEADEFARDGYFDFVVMELPFLEKFEAVAQAHLGGPGEFFDPSGLSCLAH